jgi:hypothetical protein
MITAIVIDDTGSTGAVLDKALMLEEVTLVAETLIVSVDPKPESFQVGRWIEAETLALGLLHANQIAAAKRLLVMSASITIDSPDLSRLVAEATNAPSVEHIYVSPSNIKGPIQLPDLTPGSIINSIATNQTWPLLCVATNRLTLGANSSDDATTVTELLLRSLIRASAAGDSIRCSSSSEIILSGAMLRALCELDTSALARTLSTAIDAMNIEELFPNHAWQDHSQESAAAVYHSLAALFLRFGDIESANQCLAHSERLEESPRLFALKGLIQHTQGETLGAVANMVSSLQCYETRKVPDGKHYISFKPKNLEIIASRLVDGLNALNRQDNDKALTHFSEAIFNFDSFYSEHGVQSLEKLRQ